MKILTQAPILTVDAIEPVLGFWTETLGFEITSQVGGQDGKPFVFALLQAGEVRIMYQTRESLKQDISGLKERDFATNLMLYINVDDIEACYERMEAAEKVFGIRDTFYGAREFGVREPSGNLVIFAHLPH